MQPPGVHLEIHHTQVLDAHVRRGLHLLWVGRQWWMRCIGVGVGIGFVPEIYEIFHILSVKLRIFGNWVNGE